MDNQKMIQKVSQGITPNKISNVCGEINKITMEAWAKNDCDTLARMLLAGKNKLQLAPNSELKPSLIDEAHYCIQALEAVAMNGDILFIRDPEKGFVSKLSDVKRVIYNHYAQAKKPIDYKKVEEIYRQMSVAAPAKQETKGNFIQFKNGILDLNTMTLKANDPDRFFACTVPHNYNPSTEPVELVDKIFNAWACDDPLKIDLMFAWIGYNMINAVPLHTFMVIYGPKRNGKSAFCKVITLVLGDNNTSSLPVSDLNKQFKTAALVGKLANLSTENEGGALPELITLKALTSGDKIPMERKGEDVVDYVFTTKLTFCFNQPFSTEDSSGATKARMLVLRFNADFMDPKDQDPYLIDKLQDEKAMEYIIARSVKAIKEVLDRGYFIMPEDSKEFVQEQEYRDNPIRAFYYFIESGNEVFLDSDMDLPIMTDKKFWYKYHSDQIYSAYKYWFVECSEMKGKPESKNKFCGQLKEDKNLVSYRDTDKKTNKKVTYYRQKKLSLEE
ncbi:MAG: hypothetical protein K2H85_05160 [Allobaculum sp.]|nr:hypothetical protein [Allobaculum sp.]